MLYFQRKDSRMSDQQLNEKEILAQKYRAKGFQSLSLAEYEAIRSRRNAKKFFKIPPFIQFTLGTPFLIIFLLGLFFIPWIIYLIASGPYVHWKEKKKNTDYTYQDLLIKKNDSPSPAKK